MRLGGLLALVGFCVVAGVYGTGALLSGDPEEQGDGEERPAALVMAAGPEERTLLDAFDGVGTVLARRSIEIRPLSEGRVAEVLQSSGANVTAGTPILLLNDRAEQAAVQLAEATSAETGSVLDRSRDLSESEFASDATLEAAEAAFLRAEAEVELARSALSDRRIEAPFAGVLGLIDVDPGERVDTDTVIATLDDLAGVQVEFAVPERYFPRVSTGQRVSIAAAGHGDRTFDGEVSVVAPRIDEASRSFAVRAVFPNEDRALAGGMFVEISLVFDEISALTVPDDAIISEGDVTYVYVVEDGAARRRDVELGGRVDGLVAVDGLDPEARVITAGYSRLGDGDPVRVEEDDAASPEQDVAPPSASAPTSGGGG